MTCIFCDFIKEEQILFQTEHFKVVFDIDPIQAGHLLIIAKTHVMDLRELSNEQLMDLIHIEKGIINVFETHFSIHGVTVIQNNGSIMDEGTHFHVHVVPRYEDDHFWENQAVIEREISIQQLTKQLKSIFI